MEVTSPLRGVPGVLIFVHQVVLLVRSGAAQNGAVFVWR